MEGQVGVTDNEPQGALFWVLLPGVTGEDILAPMDMDRTIPNADEIRRFTATL